MEVTKYNVCQIIEDFLKERKIRYNVIDPDSKGALYELYISSIEANIQIEFNLDDESDNYVVIQFYTNVDSDGHSLYHNTWENENVGSDSIEEEIDFMIDAIKRINQGINKIQNKIEQIKDVCEEYNLEFEDFITLNYNFD